MSKVICDVCGTTYPETASQCPICGCAKNTTSQTAAGGDSQDGGSGSYTYVKGGRFSKSNVRKRNKGQAPERRSDRGRESKGDGANKVLVAVVVILLLAIVAVLIYIGVKFFANFGDTPDPNGTGTAQTGDGTQPSGPSEPAKVLCESLTLDNTSLTFTNGGSSRLLTATVYPADTTDKTVTFTSSDESVATVSETGLITPVNYGTCTITVACGDVTATCEVTCTFGTPPETQPSEPSTPVDPDFEFEFNTIYKQGDKYDVTLTSQGYKWRAYKSSMTVAPEDITWTSDNPEICTIENGIVTVIRPGTTEVHAEYNGKKVTCIIHCSGFEYNPNLEQQKYKISHTDVTLAVGETFILTLKDEEGGNIEVDWNVSEEGFVEINGNKITGVQPTQGTSALYVTVSATYEDVTYSCTIRVKQPVTETGE